MKTEKIYGQSPTYMGEYNLNCDEMMFWLYCPVKVAGDSTNIIIPPNLMWTKPIVDAVLKDTTDLHSKYVYITAKTLYCTPENAGNRAGWHSDGFLTDDINYIWCNANPTVFYNDGNVYDFSTDHNKSLAEMDQLCENRKRHHIRYKTKSLLRLDQTVLHKVDTDIESGIRTFVKVSVSTERYALKGNSVNHYLPVDWEYQDRQVERNCPIGVK